MITNEQIQNISFKIVDAIHPDKIILFGSYAKGTNHEDSDIDIIIVKDSVLPRPHRGSAVYRLFYRSFIPMDIKFYTPAEYRNELNNKYSFLSSVINDSKVLYERKD